MENTGIPFNWVGLSKVLIRCFFLTMGFLLIWLFFLAVLPDLTYRVHTWFFDISRPQFNLVHYGGMMMAKMTAFLLFLVPYLAIRLARRQS